MEPSELFFIIVFVLVAIILGVKFFSKRVAYTIYSILSGVAAVLFSLYAKEELLVKVVVGIFFVLLGINFSVKAYYEKPKELDEEEMSDCS